MSRRIVDVIVLGAGAAGLFCAGIAGQRGLSVLLLDHAEKLAEKIRISGGGRCNFTNRHVGPEHFLSGNPHFCRSALAGFGAADFVALMQRHRLGFHEKHKGQLFCDEGSQAVIDLLLRECEAGGVTRRQPCGVQAVRRAGDGFELDTDAGTLRAPQLVVATGGLSIPAIGASDFGLRLAQQFGHAVVTPRPALVPLNFDPAAWAAFSALAGVALPVSIAVGGAPTGRGAGRPRQCFDEDLLFTHRGLSGPAVLQISSFWRPGEVLRIDLAGGADLAAALRDAKAGSRRQVATELAMHLPARLAQTWLPRVSLTGERPLAEVRDRDLATLAASLQDWQVLPSGSAGWKKAEVMAGGVDTAALDSRSMESRHIPGLHFIGEVVDVTGWLGGYNFQWAWSSAAACARSLHISRSG
jgi:predicted Rossmann fold flavoprotein